jgi:phosphatidylserine/phosphatidylglycerophosphate/cardiolipin synthase-like enzyme
MAIQVGDIEVYMGPREVGAPDNLREVIINFIDNAKSKLDIAVQELDCLDIAKAIINARQKGVTVRLVLEGDYLTVDKAVTDPFQLMGKNETNRQIHDAILRSKINVKSDFNPKIFHQKFIVRDGSALLTGSTNFTDTGTSTNLNHVITISSRRIANIYAKEFKEIMQGHFGKLNEGHDPIPDDVIVSDVPIRVLFAPDHAPEMEIMKQMLKASSRIDFAIFTFSKSSGIDDTMIALRKSKIKVRGIMDAQMANQQWAATRPLKENGVRLYVIKKDGDVRKLHHKLMVIDRQVVIAGSFNYTGPANLFNDENIIILGDLETKDGRSIEKQKKTAGYALEEIERIIKKHGERV